RALALFWSHRCKPEPAVAEHDRRDTVPAGDGAVRIPLDLRVVVGVQVHETRRHDQSAGIDDLLGSPGDVAVHLHDATIFDRDIAAISRNPCAIYDGTPANQDVI